jgi:drug/metabolite transporter (DMT)-like permease
MVKMTRQQKGVLLTLAAAFFFAGKTIIIKLAYREGIDPISLLALRMTAAGSIFVAILLYNVLRGRWSVNLAGRQWLLVMVLGFFGYYLSSYLDFKGLYYIDATLGRMILFLYPTMVIVIHAVITRTMLPLKTVLTLLLAYFGLVLMMGADASVSVGGGFWKGSGLVFLSALVYSFYLTGVDRYFSEVKMSLFISITMCFSCLSVFIHYMLSFPLENLLSFKRAVYAYALVLGTFSTVLPIYAMSLGIALIGASRAALFNMTGPIMTLVLGVLLLGERLGFFEVLGALLVIAGVAGAGRGMAEAKGKMGASGGGKGGAEAGGMASQADGGGKWAEACGGDKAAEAEDGGRMAERADGKSGQMGK